MDIQKIDMKLRQALDFHIFINYFRSDIFKKCYLDRMKLTSLYDDDSETALNSFITISFSFEIEKACRANNYA